MRSTTSRNTVKFSSLILGYGHELLVAEDGFAEISRYRQLLGRISRKRRRAAKIQKLIEHDTVAQRQREERLKAVEYVFRQPDLTTPRGISSKTQPLTTGHGIAAHHRSQKYANSFIDLRPAPARSRTLVQ